MIDESQIAAFFSVPEMNRVYKVMGFIQSVVKLGRKIKSETGKSLKGLDSLFVIRMNFDFDVAQEIHEVAFIIGGLLRAKVFFEIVGVDETSMPVSLIEEFPEFCGYKEQDGIRVRLFTNKSLWAA